MSERIKYPLTEEAKEAAQMLVEAWNNGSVQQYFDVHESSSLGDDAVDLMGGLGVADSFEVPQLGALLELAQYGLISVQRSPLNPERWEIVLLQELRNTIADSFAVSDYFLTVTAVGTINLGEAHYYSSYQSAANVYGSIVQNANRVASEVEQLLGESLLQSHEELADLIRELREASPNETPSISHRLLTQLAALIGVVTQTADVLTAIETISGFLKAHY